MKNVLSRLSAAQQGYLLLIAGFFLLLAGFGYFEHITHQILFLVGLIVFSYGFVQSGLLAHFSNLMSRIAKRGS